MIISLKFPTVTLQQSKSSVSVHGGDALRHLRLEYTSILSLKVCVSFLSMAPRPMVLQSIVITAEVGRAFSEKTQTNTISCFFGGVREGWGKEGHVCKMGSFGVKG